ncbi:hypothetical protein H0H81_012105 [Sphagnurus paluster]|uniref:PPM-type phosphatase domain-containing protein n=1 Tax=Sphagnurus paluster TaxID=117069 RepID=A0A9P7GS70_9AGAR|nr:hypothetical protein H0H81_012105 [Sphagnurus paluster]
MALRLLNTRKFNSNIQNLARYHDYVRLATPGGVIRVPLASPKVIGIANSRGNRSHQEDFYGFATLSLDPEELRVSVKKSHGVDWDPRKVGDAFSGQVVFVGIYDGHGGSAVSQYLRQELHGIFESVNKAAIPELFAWIKELGGYFKRFKGGALAPWIHDAENMPPMDLEARATEAFFEDWAYLVFVSDGVSSILSDEEVVDLARNARDPKSAAESILAFAQELGGDDNATALVVPLAGWGKIQGPDRTKELREYRRQQAVGSERQRRM